ncbi:hypothetical protein BH09SUM1_BH09SUM1_17890 [soil metagenome]
MKTILSLLLLAAAVSSCGGRGGKSAQTDFQPTIDDGKMLLLTQQDLAAGPHHTQHEVIFSKYARGYNREVLAGVDKVQSSAMDGGGYFIGIKAQPTESPIGYDLALFDKPLLKAPRTTSYCSGSSYSAFIEGMNLIFPEKERALDETHYEAMRMQEPDGGRREDWVKFWGLWNADGFGSNFALVQYSGMGKDVTPAEARPGDFMNISWKSGNGHSVVFLGWYQDPAGEKKVLYWASQGGTNGLGDQMSPISKIQEVKIVRLTNPDAMMTFDPAKTVNKKVAGDQVGW